MARRYVNPDTGAEMYVNEASGERTPRRPEEFGVGTAVIADASAGTLAYILLVVAVWRFLTKNANCICR
jgi:hypothetical protein